MSDKNKNESTKRKSLLDAYYKAAKPALKYKWCYVVLTLIGLVLIAADLMFARPPANYSI